MFLFNLICRKSRRNWYRIITPWVKPHTDVYWRIFDGYRANCNGPLHSFEWRRNGSYGWKRRPMVLSRPFECKSFSVELHRFVLIERNFYQRFSPDISVDILYRWQRSLLKLAITENEMGQRKSNYAPPTLSEAPHMATKGGGHLATLKLCAKAS